MGFGYPGIRLAADETQSGRERERGREGDKKNMGAGRGEDSLTTNALLGRCGRDAGVLLRPQHETESRYRAPVGRLSKNSRRLFKRSDVIQQ